MERPKLKITLEVLNEVTAEFSETKEIVEEVIFIFTSPEVKS